MRCISICLLIAACLAGPGCTSMKPTGWMVTEVASLGQLDQPVSAAIDPVTGMAYVACRGPVLLDPDKMGPPAPSPETNRAYILRLKPGGRMDVARWRASTADVPLGLPQGMCIVAGNLYVATPDHVVVYPLTGDKPGRVVMVPGTKYLRGMATDGTSAYVVDSEAWRVYRVVDEGPAADAKSPAAESKSPAADAKSPTAEAKPAPAAKSVQPVEIKAPPDVIGIAFAGKQLFAVSGQLHEIYELDTSGKDEPTPLGLDKEFNGPVAIQTVDDGSLIVADAGGHQLVLVTPDHKKVRVLATVTSPGMIALDAKRGFLYVPLHVSDRVNVYRLEKPAAPVRKPGLYGLFAPMQ